MRYAIFWCLLVWSMAFVIGMSFASGQAVGSTVTSLLLMKAFM